jgi:hypothetical protein
MEPSTCRKLSASGVVASAMWSRKKKRVVEADCRLAFFCNVALLRLSKTVPGVRHVRPAFQFYGYKFSLFSFELQRDADIGVGCDTDGNRELRVVLKGDLAPIHLRIVGCNQQLDGKRHGSMNSKCISPVAARLRHNDITIGSLYVSLNLAGVLQGLKPLKRSLIVERLAREAVQKGCGRRVSMGCKLADTVLESKPRHEGRTTQDAADARSLRASER